VLRFENGLLGIAPTDPERQRDPQVRVRIHRLLDKTLRAVKVSIGFLGVDWRIDLWF
jgi:hypothetical protein